MRAKDAAAALGMGEAAFKQAVLRYEAHGLLKVERNSAGDRVYTGATLEEFKAAREAVRAGMVQKCSEVQSERLASKALTEQRLRKSTKALEAQLRQTESQVITQRIREVLNTYPSTATDDWELVLIYYRVFHGTENLRAAKADGAPFPDTITRRKRDILKKEATA
jgi:DNA-binding transcriptional MerR regulator